MDAVFLMRITLPDRPEFAGVRRDCDGKRWRRHQRRRRLSRKKSDGSVVDDFIVDLPPNQLPETLVTACQRDTRLVYVWSGLRAIPRVAASIRPEALERMTADPPHAAETLVSLCPVVFRSHWAT